MIRQYLPQRCRRIELGGRVREIGTVPVGAILFVEGRKIRVEAWLPRDYPVFARGRFVTKRIAGGHLALVRDLATGRVRALSDAWLVDAPEVEGVEQDGRAPARKGA